MEHVGVPGADGWTWNLADLLEVAADRHPGWPMVVAGEERRTFAELDERATRFGHHLIAVGVEPGDHVAILSWNRVEWYEAMYGCFKARAVPVNVNYRYVDPEVQHVLTDAGCVAVVVEADLLPIVERIRPACPTVRHVVVLDDGAGGDVGFEAALASASPVRVGLPARSGDDRYVIYTGGTTGLPKGVVWRHEDLVFGALGGGRPGGDPLTRPSELLAHVAEPQPPILVTSPMMHGNAQWSSWFAMFNGCPAVLWTGRHFDPAEVAALAERERAGVLVLVGDGMCRPFVDHLAVEPGRWDLSSVWMVMSGGTTLSPDTKERLGEVLPGAIVFDGLGASETGANATMIGGAAGHPPRFLPNADTAVVDDDLVPLAPGSGAVGLLAKRGPLPLGYLNDPEKTAATFPTGPDGTRWSVPGDLARLEADGTITLLGRKARCINTGGEKVFPEEVELALKSHPAVADAIVVGTPDERYGSLVTVVAQPRPGHRLVLEELQAHLRGQLAGYKLPRRVVVVDAIAYTGPGKPDLAWAAARAELSSTSHVGNPR